MLIIQHRIDCMQFLHIIDKIIKVTSGRKAR